MENAIYEKVLILGIDGTDPVMTQQLMDAGELPHFKQLQETGHFSKLHTNLPPESPSAWSSIATGLNPGKHNVFGFIDRDPKTYLPALTIMKHKSGLFGVKYLSPMQATPFWKITSEAGLPTRIIRWPLTFPPDKIRGNMFPGLGVPDIKGLLGQYSFYSSADLSGKEKGSGLDIAVSNNDVIDTYISGPRTRKGTEVVDVTVPMQIKRTDKSVVLLIQGKEYPVAVDGWSDWIRIKFKVSLMNNVYGVFKAYLISTEPDFNLYLSSAQIDPENPIVDLTYPKDFSKKLVQDIGMYHTLGMPEDTKALTEERVGDKVFLSQVNLIEEEREKMFWHQFKEFQNEKNGVYAFVFDTSDRIMHNYWDAKYLDNPGEGSIKINQNIINHYKRMDKLLGEVLQKIDNNTALIIISDHGFTSFERSVNINNWLIENGFMTLTGEPNPDDPGLFQNVDWANTKAYSLGFSSIYVNLKGREGKGIVEDKESVVKEIMEKLIDLEDPKTNKKVIHKLYTAAEAYSGPFLHNAPDVIVGFTKGYRMDWRNAIGGVAKSIFQDNDKKWKGDHIVDPSFVPGVIFTNFKIKQEEAHQRDIAPTTLYLLGLTVPENMDGQVLEPAR